MAAWSDGRFELLATLEILIEYRRVAERLHDEFPTVEFEKVLDLITQETRIVEPLSVPETACDDPDDLKFLSCTLLCSLRQSRLHRHRRSRSFAGFWIPGTRSLDTT